MLTEKTETNESACIWGECTSQSECHRNQIADMEDLDGN